MTDSKDSAPKAKLLFAKDAPVTIQVRSACTPTRAEEAEGLLLQLARLSSMSIDEVIKKVQEIPLDIDTILDFYRVMGRFPGEYND